jgi:hypothetical protein
MSVYTKFYFLFKRNPMTNLKNQKDQLTNKKKDFTLK